MKYEYEVYWSCTDCDSNGIASAGIFDHKLNKTILETELNKRACYVCESPVNGNKYIEKSIDGNEITEVEI